MSISLDEIEALARDESAKMQHFFIGVEHLFLALTRLEGSLTRDVLEQMGQSAHYLRYATRDLIGRGDESRRWTGYPRSPRAESVLERARAMIRSGTAPAERALLLAMLEEGQSIPIRVLRSAKVDLAALRKAILEWSGELQVSLPPPQLIGSERLAPEQCDIIERMFRRYDSVNIEQLFTEGFSGYSGATVLLARPLHADGRADAPVVVKLDERQAILWEKKRYDTFVRDRLPAQTSRIDAEPTLSDDSPLGGLKYTFIRRGDEELPINLSHFAASQPPEDTVRFLRDGLFNGFQETWWGQAQPYTFTVWQEYDLVLPPALVVQALPESALGPTSRRLRPLDEQNSALQAGEIIALEEFAVLKVRRDRGTLQLVSGTGPEAINFSGRVRVNGLNFSQRVPFRGEIMTRLVGRITQTRDDILQSQVQALEPDFNLLEDWLPNDSALERALPNPLRHYDEVRQRRIIGTFSSLHGDLHTGNILVGPGGVAWLIDFEWARDGHTLFDWAVLEVSLFIDHVVTLVEDDWAALWPVIALLDQVNHSETPDSSTPVGAALAPVAEIRRIVARLLAQRMNWAEYFIPLALCALRVISWENRPLAARRLAYLISALALDAAREANELFLQHHTLDLTTEGSTDQGFGMSLSGTPRTPIQPKQQGKNNAADA